MSHNETTRRQRQRGQDTSPEAIERQKALLRQYLGDREAAAALGVAARTLRSWRQEARGPPWVKIGKFVYYRIAVIEAWLQSLEGKPARSRRAA
jgi:hypothetical protein